MEAKPDPNLVIVEGRARGELRATRALLTVEVEGSSRRKGDIAAETAEEVVALRTAAREGGVADEDVELLEVRMSSEQGLLLKSSAATYRLRVTVRDLERLGEVLGRLAALDEFELSDLQWRFDEEEKVIDDLLAEATTRAKGRALRIAESLGQTLGSIHRLHSRRGAPVMMARSADLPRGAAALAKTGGPAPAFASLGGVRRQDVEVTVEAQFHVG